MDFEHGCSQSFENLGVSGTMSLSLKSDHQARFDLEYEESSVFGPSPGRHMEGDRDYTRTRSKHHSTWTGKASKSAEGMLFEFNTVNEASVDLPQYGDQPLPAANKSATSFTLLCRPTTVQAYPAPRTDGWAMASTEDGETTSPRNAMACAPSMKLFHLMDLIQVNERLLIADGDGLLVSSWTMWMDEQQVVRLAPPVSEPSDTP